MDALTRFLIESGAARGEHAALGESWTELLSRRPYPEPVRDLVGHALAAAALFSTTIKSSGRITLQLQGNGCVSLLVAQCTGEGGVRATAEYDVSAVRGSAFSDMVGDGQLVVTLERDSGRQYQGIVELTGKSLAGALERYFGQSEQVPCQLQLAADAGNAAGFLLQRLPGNPSSEPDWERVCTLAGTLHHDELLQLESRKILHRLFHEERVRVFSPRPLTFQCGCSEERIIAVLSGMDPAEIEDILKQEGELSVTCEFCGARYQVDPEHLHAGGASLTRH